MLGWTSEVNVSPELEAEKPITAKQDAHMGENSIKIFLLRHDVVGSGIPSNRDWWCTESIMGTNTEA